MVLIVYVDQATRLFAEMIAATPSNEPLPPSCNDAFAPVESADVDRCAEFSRELALSENMFEGIAKMDQPFLERASFWMTFDIKQSVGLKAERFTASCGDAAAQRLLGDKPLHPKTVIHPLQDWRLECVANSAGCMLIEIADYDYMSYDKRVLDYTAHLRLAATLIWLRESPGAATSIEQRLDSRPAQMRSDGHASGFDAAHNLLYVENLDQHRAKRFELALPAEIIRQP